MNIEQLLYIVEVDKHSSQSAAAQNLHVTQSTISQSITNLENELGIKILNRSRGSRAVPTDEGRIILQHAYRVLRHLEDIKEIANAFYTTESGELKISTMPGLMTILVDSIAVFRHDYPHVNIEIDEKSSSSVIDAVRQCKADIGLITHSNVLFNINMEGIAFEPLIQGKQKVYVSKDSPLAVLGPITPEELLDQTLVTYKGELIQLFVQDFFNKYKPMKIMFTSNNMDGVLKAISKNLAITFAPDFIMKNMSPVINGDIVPIDLVNYTDINISLGLVRSENKHITAFTSKFIHYLKSQMIKS
ncbi:LysR family transcriptional regulator [Priestia megaterium]|uniref:LysR family transcriptional regulator n=1 Tax=Priestia megaterium TaxID=1404 RepID=A0A6H1P2Q9_PRIMG|nr:LysR family transcriptional regulator [Priestia megaterium]QIZ07745.1 LysR family transcriptional regulator [Priestia megaterium]